MCRLLVGVSTQSRFKSRIFRIVAVRARVPAERLILATTITALRGPKGIRWERLSRCCRRRETSRVALRDNPEHGRNFCVCYRVLPPRPSGDAGATPMVWRAGVFLCQQFSKDLPQSLFF